jgi:O-antigen/teichoic acid export membrane protein
MTFNESLREGQGRVSSGPPLRSTLIIGAGAFTLVALLGVGLLISPAPTELAVAMLIMALFTAFRTMISVLQVVLYAQRRDVARLAANLGLVPVKLGLVALLAAAGAVGGAIASAVADALLLAVYLFMIYRRTGTKEQT